VIVCALIRVISDRWRAGDCLSVIRRAPDPGWCVPLGDQNWSLCASGRSDPPSNTHEWVDFSARFAVDLISNPHGRQRAGKRGDQGLRRERTR